MLPPEELLAVLGCVVAANDSKDDTRHVAIDGKTMRATKDDKGNAAHMLSAFC
jgi:hypothetical protein